MLPAGTSGSGGGRRRQPAAAAMPLQAPQMQCSPAGARVSGPPGPPGSPAAAPARRAVAGPAAGCPAAPSGLHDGSQSTWAGGRGCCWAVRALLCALGRPDARKLLRPYQLGLGYVWTALIERSGLSALPARHADMDAGEESRIGPAVAHLRLQGGRPSQPISRLLPQPPRRTPLKSAGDMAGPVDKTAIDWSRCAITGCCDVGQPARSAAASAPLTLLLRSSVPGLAATAVDY